MMRIDAVWLSVEPIDMRAGLDTCMSRVIAVFGAARPHHACLFSNRRANRIKVLVHDGVGIWLCARRLYQGKFVWPSKLHSDVNGTSIATTELTQAQWQALVVGLPWQRIGDAGVMTAW